MITDSTGLKKAAIIEKNRAIADAKEFDIMDTATVKNKIEYIVTFISEFSKRHNMPEAETYRYLKQYGVISLIDKCYDVMHTQSFSDMVDDMTAYCHRKGGYLL